VASGAWTGNKNTSGSETIGSIDATSTYTLFCSGSGGSVSESVVVTVTSPSANPTVSMSADPMIVKPNDITTLTWSAQNADSCEASGAWAGNKATSGSETSGPISAASIFTLTCTNQNGSTNKAITVVISDDLGSGSFGFGLLAIALVVLMGRMSKGQGYRNRF
jgi:hypothetical protein